MTHEEIVKLAEKLNTRKSQGRCRFGFHRYQVVDEAKTTSWLVCSRCGKAAYTSLSADVELKWFESVRALRAILCTKQESICGSESIFTVPTSSSESPQLKGAGCAEGNGLAASPETGALVVGTPTRLVASSDAERRVRTRSTLDI